jgi:hypothetical protein
VCRILIREVQGGVLVCVEKAAETATPIARREDDDGRCMDRSRRYRAASAIIVVAATLYAHLQVHEARRAHGTDPAAVPGVVRL